MAALERIMCFSRYLNTYMINKSAFFLFYALSFASLIRQNYELDYPHHCGFI